ncbi:alpha/beta hydrolase [Halalkalicoccus tibetensis]|uniref:Alpha/beta fold hydrolase n=1 Tax=Halalkalicoccus tibetensis TaxID=175632 RepID=A0ABD5V8D6_9EURY
MESYEEWTAAQESETVSVDGHGLEMAYRDEGSGGEGGGPLVFLHGIPTNSYLWREVAPAFEDERRVIVPDMVGYGSSDMHDGFDRSIRAQEIAVEDLLSGLGIDSCTFVGHDLGGGVGLRLAAHRPDLVEELVLSNAVAYDSWPVQFVTDMGLPSFPRENEPEEVRETLGETFRQGVYGEADDAFVEGMVEPWASEEGAVSLSRAASATNTNHTTEIDPSTIEAGTLLLWGAEDEFQPIEYAERLAEDVDESELVALDEAYHWVVEDRPEAYREHLREFLDG